MVKKVAVIGAGVSGLASLKCCLDEGLEPTCFERGDDIGGLWKFNEYVEDGRASIYKSVVTNTSKEMTCYSDFPMPDRFPNFLPNYKMMDYYKLYAKNFDLIRHIQFKTIVLSVRKRPDFSTSGQWDIVTEKDGKRESDVFDAVLLCTGHHVEPYLPLDSFPGIEKFKGQCFHSREYKHPDAFKGKRVIILGMGNTGADLAVELSHTADKVFLSTRRGSWVMSRVYDWGYPWDMVYNTRFKSWYRNSLPTSIARWLTHRKMNSWFDHANYGLLPQDSSQWKEPLFNDELPSRITCGFVVTKPNVVQFTETAARFEDGTVEDNIDVVIFATGYTYSCPLLQDSGINNQKMNSLYRRIFVPGLEKPTLGVIGFIQPLGSIMPTTEMQARWAIQVFKGMCKLPPLKEIMEDISRKNEILLKSFGTARQNCLQLDQIEYFDELATDIGAKPNIPWLFLTDPQLALEIFFGSFTPFQYRLTGPGKWPGARGAIMSQWERIVMATRNRHVKIQPSHSPLLVGLVFFCLFVALVAFCFI
ncbi:dimethylaniline monooxygenase [N-oxide-forming] 2-like [Ambystoma mexicanum]|uniref:dimethylaniline monooxygenase [N-oxide-forming] 2-like n=1 Tax=Ambystoma mexicanum TaxID=8296 RepID=UPI0037E8F09A